MKIIICLSFRDRERRKGGGGGRERERKREREREREREKVKETGGRLAEGSERELERVTHSKSNKVWY